MTEEAAPPVPAPPPERRIFANRTLNLRAIRAVGFDMDYTLVHYRVAVWERHAYERARQRLIERGWPLEKLAFDPSFVILGLIVDLELGNLVKASRFGYVMRAYHGTKPLEFERQREFYARLLVDLHEPRWVFLNTWFSLSEALLFAQCVDLLDRGLLEAGINYADLYAIVRAAIDRTHTEGELKAAIASSPEQFVELDAELGLTLSDLKHAGKMLLLVTNSEWSYTTAMMSYTFDRYLPHGKTWRDLFDVTIVMARKPEFFSARSPFFEVVSDDGLLRPAFDGVRVGGAYVGGNARELETYLNLRPEEILYFGDHPYADVHVSKDLLRWRTALVVRDLEREIAAVEGFRALQLELTLLMTEKEQLEQSLNHRRLELQRAELGYAASARSAIGRVGAEINTLRQKLAALDQRIVPLATAAGELGSQRWGLMMRAGIDKSFLARQIERYADVYLSRVANLLFYTPFVYLRAPRVNLPHDEHGAGADQ